MGRFQIKSLFNRTGSTEQNRRRNKRTIPDSGTTVLVVDDSKTVRTLLQKMLHQGSFNTLEAEDGETAVKMAKQHQPHIILMDVVMPGINGFQATRQIRKDPDTRDIPIVIMSGNEQATEEFWVIRIGANDFMGKPFTRGEVYRRIERILYNNEII